MKITLDNTVKWEDFSQPCNVTVHGPSDRHTFLLIPYDANDNPIAPDSGAVSGTATVEARPLAAPFFENVQKKDKSGQLIVNVGDVETYPLFDKPLNAFRFTQDTAISGCAYIMIVINSGL